MENFYMKYETAFLSNYALDEILPLLNKWKDNLNEEKNNIENMIDKNNNVIPFQIQKMLNNLSEIINIHYDLIDEYIFCITEYEVDLSDNIQKAKISYLKETYNRILLLIEKIFVKDKVLSALKDDIQIDMKHNEIKIPKEFIEVIEKEIQNIKDEQIEKENNFNYRNNKIYPKAEQMDQMFDEFIQKARADNEKIAIRAKYCPNKKIKENILNKKIKINMNTTYRYNINKPNIKSK